MADKEVPNRSIEINNCVDCTEHRVLPDPDPDDWFCDDDVKVICGVNNKQITGSCRPYNTRKECNIPEWCPKLKEGKSNDNSNIHS